MVPFRVFTFVLGLSVLLSSAQASDCPEGQYYHSSLQRCLLNKKTVSTKTNANRCEGKSGDEYAKCFKDNIEDEIKDLEKAESISQGNWHKATVPLTVGLLAGYYLVTNKDTFSQCKATSIWLMLGGAAAGAVTEISAQLTYSKKIKSVHEKYNKQISETRASDDEETQKSTEAQTLALEAMKEQEGARLKASSTRKSGHSLSMALYASAVVAAIYEQYQMGFGSPMGSCLQSGAASSAPTGAYFTPMERKKINLSAMWLHPDFREQFEEYSYLEEVTVAQMFELIQRKLYQNIFITNAVAEDGFEEQPSQPEPENSQLQDTIVNIGAPIAANQLLNSSSASPVLEVAADQPLQAIQEASKSELGTGVKGWIDKSIATPWVRAALSGALGTYASMLKNNAKKNENLSKKRIEALDEILVSFVDSGGARFDLACSDEEKDNPSKPECYCFNDSGSQNVQRQDRVVCKAYFEQRNLIANKYSGLGNLGYSPVKACIQTDGEVDLDCSVCKKTPSKCPVVASASLGTINLPKSLGVESLMKQSNSIASGRMELAQLDTAGLEKKAARISSITDKLGEKKPYKEIVSKVKNLENDFLKAAPALFKKSFGSSGASSSPLASSGSNAPIAPSKKTSEKASEDAGKTGIQMKSAGTYTATGSTKAQEDFDFGFGDENQGGVEIVGDAQDVMKKDFAIKGDIHKNSQTNIFQILSLRYQRSALRRLFGNPETSSESNAQGTEIEQK